MIIDFHMHPFCKEVDFGNLEKIADVMWGEGTKKRKAMFPFLKTVSEKISITNYISLMDKFKIEKAIIVSMNIESSYGIILVSNEDIRNFMEMYPDRFIGFAGIDPPAIDVLEQLEYAIESLDLKGVKIVPPVQKFDVSNDKYNEIWEKIEEYGIPLWIHTGHQLSTKGSIAKFGHPMLIDELALKHEDLKIIMGHMGTPWFWDAYSVVLRHPNVYIDISAHPELYQYFPWDAYNKYNIDDKVLFASDHPLMHWNQIIPAAKDLPISEAFKQNILYNNAQKFLKELI
ncbi:MAG: amidohydrolase [Promethearchaeota archaeon]|nr:MAG: amidohydrolase [Candidatus Lokiarchaeota archaeon]